MSPAAAIRATCSRTLPFMSHRLSCPGRPALIALSRSIRPRPLLEAAVLQAADHGRHLLGEGLSAVESGRLSLGGPELDEPLIQVAGAADDRRRKRTLDLVADDGPEVFRRCAQLGRCLRLNCCGGASLRAHPFSHPTSGLDLSRRTSTARRHRRADLCRLLLGCDLPLDCLGAGIVGYAEALLMGLHAAEIGAERPCGSLGILKDRPLGSHGDGRTRNIALDLAVERATPRHLRHQPRRLVMRARRSPHADRERHRPSGWFAPDSMSRFMADRTNSSAISLRRMPSIVGDTW